MPLARSAAAALLSLFIARFAPAEPQRWTGEWRCEAQPVRVGLEIDAEAQPPVGSFDAPSLHLPSVPCASITVSPDGIVAELPASLGSLRATVHPDALAGIITLPDGRSGAVRFERSPLAPVAWDPIRFSSGSAELSGSVVHPVGSGPFPGIVLVHGGGDSRTQDEGYRFWMEHFARRGFAVLGWDKRGCGDSTGAWREVGLGPLADDAAAAAEALAARSDVDASRFGALAFSQGGWVAPLAASQTEAIRFIAVVSGPAVSVVEADTAAARNSYRAAGMTEQEAAEALDLWRRLLAAIDDNSLWDDYLGAFERVHRHDWIVRSGRKPAARDGWFVNWYRRVKDHQPLPVLERTRIPMLWLFGAEDTQLDAPESAAILARFAQKHEKDYSIHLFPHAGHGLNRSLGDPDTGPYAIVPGALEALEAWLDAQ